MSPLRTLSVALAAAVLAGLAIGSVYQAGRASGRLEGQAQLQAHLAEDAKAIAAMSENFARLRDGYHRNMELAQDAYKLSTSRALADADGARAAADQLRQRAARLAADAARCQAAPPAATPGSAPASAPADLLADVLGRLDQAAGELAAYADGARSAGQLCERIADGDRKP